MKLLMLKNILKNVHPNVSKSKSILLGQPGHVYTKYRTATAAAINTKLEPFLKVNDTLHGFRVKNVEIVPEFQLTAYKLIHERTGGEYLHIDRNDNNNAFAVEFRTTPTDSTGLPHILEHTTLCGSKKYPCRDPFFKMLNRSLATFMNAMTGPDYTIYPFSTQNIKDYQNLMSVYLDAVFNPNLREKDFNQEGWRLEHTEPSDPSSPIIIKGVVYNEMKGVFSENQNILFEALQNHMLPSHTYGVISGGDPVVIPQLKYLDLVNFHKKYYSVSNARFYSYGNFPLENHLKYLNETYLAKAEVDPTVRKSSFVPNEKKWTESVRKHVSCHPDPLAADPNKTSSIAVSYLCPSVTDIEEVTTLQILAELLVKGPNSAFYKTLVETNIGSGFSPVTGYSAYTKDTLFTIGLQGVGEKDFDKILQIIDDTIENVIKDGFKQELIDAILHSYELHIKHQSSDFGLGLLFGITSLWNHEGDVINALNTEAHINSFKNKIKDQNYLKNKVKKYFKDNKHKLVLTMSPDDNYGEMLKQKEEEILKNKLTSLNKTQIDEIYKNGLDLLQDQSKEQDASCLPTLKITDLSKSVDLINYNSTKIGDTYFQIVEQPTNGITYFRGLINTHNISEDLKGYIPLFSFLSTRMGTKKHNYKDFDQLVQMSTGGLFVSTHIRSEITSFNMFEENILFSSHCLDRNVEKTYDIWYELITDVSFQDRQRFETLVKVNAASLVNGIVDSGHHLAMLLSGSLVAPSGLLKEKYGGLTYVNEMKNTTSNLDKTLDKMRQISETVFNKKNFKCSLNVCEKDQIISKTDKFIKQFNGTNTYRNEMTKPSAETKESKGLFYVLPSNISFASKAIMSVPYKHEDYAPLRILSKLISSKYLLKEVREKGGAYGAGLAVNTDGVLLFYSYRDPNPENTFRIYDESVNWFNNYDLKQVDIDEAKLGVFQGVDSPTPPGNVGLRRFLHGIDDDCFSEHRLQLMNVTRDQLVHVANKYLNNNRVCGRSLLGPENLNIVNSSEQKWNIVAN